MTRYAAMMFCESRMRGSKLMAVSQARPTDLRDHREGNRRRHVPAQYSRAVVGAALSAPAGSASLYPEGGWLETPARHPCHRRSCSTGSGEDRYRTSVRGGLQRLLVRLPAPEECSPGVTGSIRTAQIRLPSGGRCGYQVVLRPDTA